jgi:tetrahydromethanopterin:alpha-L-glutamate ligase
LTDSLCIGVVGLPGAWSTEHLADTLAVRTGSRLLIDMGEVVADLERGRVMFGDVDLCGCDALIVKKIGAQYGPDTLDALDILRYVAASGVRVFSDPGRIHGLIDRASCTLALRRHGIPMPPTVLTPSPARAVEAVRRFGGAVLKPLYSTKARGMCIVSDLDEDLVQQVQAFRDAGNPMMYIQQKIDIPSRDLGVAYLGGKYLATYARVKAEGAWSTTTREGGRYEAHQPSDATLEIADRAQRIFGLDFTTVDVAETEAGPVVFEVSAFGGFRGLREGNGVDVASLYVDHVIAQARS